MKATKFLIKIGEEGEVRGVVNYHEYKSGDLCTHVSNMVRDGLRSLGGVTIFKVVMPQLDLKETCEVDLVEFTESAAVTDCLEVYRHVYTYVRVTYQPNHPEFSTAVLEELKELRERATGSQIALVQAQQIIYDNPAFSVLLQSPR